MTSYHHSHTSEMTILNNVQRSIGAGTRANTANYNMDMTNLPLGVKGTEWPNSSISDFKYQPGDHISRKKQIPKITDKNGNSIDLPRKDYTNINHTQRKDTFAVSSRKKHILKITDKDGNEIDFSMYRTKPLKKNSKKKEEAAQLLDRKKNVLNITDKNGEDIAMPN